MMAAVVAAPDGASSWRGLAARLGPGLRMVQFAADVTYGDAASTDTMLWRETFVRAGIEAPVYARTSDAHHADVCHPLSAYRHHPGDVLIYHYTAWSDTADFLLRLGRPLILLYHNVTPPGFFAGVDGSVERETRRGRADLGRFAPLAILAAANSEFSRADLRDAGFARTSVIPVRIDFETLDRECNGALASALSKRGPAVLAVGRIAPNKGLEDVIKVFAYFRARIAPTARLYCVGARSPGGAYEVRLDWLVRKLGLGEAVHFTGRVPHADRGAYYRGSRVLLTMSEHEGFGVPVIEAMHLGLPVVGFAGSALPETIGDAGVLVTARRLDVIAEAVALAAADTPLRRRLVERGRARAQRFSRDRVAAEFVAQLAAAIDR